MQLNNLVQQLLPLYEHPDVARENALALLAVVTGTSRTKLLLTKEIHLSLSQQHQLEQYVHEVTVEHKPLQYIIGEVPFCNLSITVEPPLLIPRPETEAWISELIDRYAAYRNEPLTLLDMCTGTGCIALTLAQTFPNSTVYAVDISEQALACVQKNTTRNNVSNIIPLTSDLFTALAPTEQFDLIVTNPPYISKTEWHKLEPEVKLWEDYRALVAEQNGYELITKIIQQAPAYIKRTSPLAGNAQLFIEIGYAQGEQVSELMRAQQFTPAIISDISGLDRVVTGVLNR